MQISLPVTKLLKFEFEKLLSSENWLLYLLEGNFYEFEQLLYKHLLELYDKLCSHLIHFISNTDLFLEKQRDLAKTHGLKKLVIRPASIQLRTGTKIKYPSLYAKEKPTTYKGSSRHLSQLHWHTINSSGPMYASLTCLLSVLCPSFDLSKELLRYMNIGANADRVRGLSLALAQQCMLDRAGCQIAPNESLADKQVIIGIDGGRTRSRVYKKKENGELDSSFKTPWREPKLFVITTIDENGKISKNQLPIYDASFGDIQTIELLRQYLERLQVNKAANVQILADGAPWIWRQLPAMLLKIGVEKSNIIETLDYYHAMEHLHELKTFLQTEKQTYLFEKLSYHLHRGEIVKMKKTLKQGIGAIDLDNFTPWLYFEKNADRINYQQLKKQNRPCGSGIIESGIRRIINLRFKAPSSFWYPENVEKLILMRSIALAGRWDIMMQNINR